LKPVAQTPRDQEPELIAVADRVLVEVGGRLGVGYLAVAD